jgi:hypothetical protein
MSDTTHPAHSLQDKTPADEKLPYLMQIFTVGAVYFLIVAGAGFVLEVIRFQIVALHISEKVSEIMGIPNVLLASMIGARWVIDRFILPPLPGIRLGVGLVGLSLMLISEWTLLQAMQSLAISGYITAQVSAVPMLPIGALEVVTVMPFLVGYRWER